MLVARLMDSASPGSKQDISSNYFACVENKLRTADGSSVAYQKEHMWYTASGELLASIDFSEHVLVRFENPGMSRHEDLGPFQNLQLINGAMWMRGPDPQFIAEFHDALHLWSI